VALLVIRDLTVQFGGLRAVDRFDLSVEAGRIHSLIGPNGAGKSTVINAVTGLYPVRTGSICLDGEELLGLPPHRIAERGITRTFQNLELFGEMTVLDNVLVGAHRRIRYGVASAVLRVGSGWRRERREVERTERLLELVGLADERQRPAHDLPFAKQRRVELARALAAAPRVLLLDEPAAGMAAADIAALNKILVGLKERDGLTIVLVDHVMPVVMEISDVVTVLHHGRAIAEGPVDAVRTDPDVVRAYLGERRAGRA
jgi:branched-chain amino acid transport system ATP-binding protein